MKNTLSRFFVPIAFALFVIVLSGCSSIRLNAPTAAPANTTTPTAAPTNTTVPTSAPTATNTSVATATPAATATTAATNTLSPTTFPTSPGNSIVLNAISKTRSATNFRARQTLAANLAVVNGVPQITNPQGPEAFTVEIAGTDSHVVLMGLAVIFLADPGSTQFEYGRVGSKIFVHGPASTFGAPENKWYVMPAGASADSLTIKPFALFDQLTLAVNRWVSFAKTQSAVALDNQTCDVYSSTKPGIMAALFAAFNGDMPTDGFVLANDGFASVTVCNDGYLHDVTFHQGVAIKTNPDKKGALDLNMHYSDFGKIAVSAPGGAVTAVPPTTPEANDTPTSEPAEATPTEGAAPTAGDPISILNTFINNVNNRNLDAALGVVGDDVIYNVGAASGIGKANLRTALQDLNTRGVTLTTSNVQALADSIVTFSLSGLSATTTNGNQIILADGKITILTLK